MQITRREFIHKSSIATAGAVLGAHTGCRSNSAATRPNIIVLYSDELTHEYLSCYGGSIPTPNLDSLAREGMKFTNAYVAAPMCTPSRFALLTGTFAGRCERLADTNAPYMIGWNTPVGGAQTIPGVIRSAGYTSGAVGKWHLGGINNQSQETIRESVKAAAGFDHAASILPGNWDRYNYHNIPWFTKGAVDFINQQKGKSNPFFLYVASTAVHGPAHQEALTRDITQTPWGTIPDIGTYGLDQEALKDEVSSWPPYKQHQYVGMKDLDNHVGHILKAVKENGMEENTLIFFLSDHNIEPGKASCYDKGCRVPMIVKWPGVVRPGTTSSSLVHHVDIAQTVFDVAGVSSYDKIDGVSMLGLFQDPTASTREHAYMESGYTRAVRLGKYKYIAVKFPQSVIEKTKSSEYAPNYFDNHKQDHSQICLTHFPHYFDQDQLYDLETDPYEQNNLALQSSQAAKLAECKSVLRTYLDTFVNPYSLDTIPYMQTAEWRRKAENTRSIGTEYIEWRERDHGTIHWPPRSVGATSFSSTHANTNPPAFCIYKQGPALYLRSYRRDCRSIQLSLLNSLGRQITGRTVQINGAGTHPIQIPGLLADRDIGRTPAYYRLRAGGSTHSGRILMIG